MSESADSTTVAEKLIKTDDCQQPSRDVSSTENQKGSQLECATEEDGKQIAQGACKKWVNLLRRWVTKQFVMTFRTF